MANDSEEESAARSEAMSAMALHRERVPVPRNVPRRYRLLHPISQNNETQSET